MGAAAMAMRPHPTLIFLLAMMHDQGVKGKVTLMSTPQQPSGGCDPANVIIRAGSANLQNLEQMVQTFRRCGVVALESAAVPAVVSELRSELETAMQPWLDSRTKVRRRLREAMANHESLRQVWDEVRNESMFKHGETFRERHDGRIDVSMPTATTDKLATEDAVMGSKDVVTLLTEVLGGDVQL